MPNFMMGFVPKNDPQHICFDARPIMGDTVEECERKRDEFLEQTGFVLTQWWSIDNFKKATYE